MRTEDKNEWKEVKTIEAHLGNFCQEAHRASMINATTKLEKTGMLKELEDADTLKRLRSSYEDHQTYNRGKQGKLVIKRMKEGYK